MSEPQKAAEPAPPTHESATCKPAVRVIESKKKKRRKISRELRDLETAERYLGRAAQRTARAMADGLDTYQRRRRRSARRKRDGALRDLPRNAAQGMAETLRVGSRVPVDLARAVDTPTVRRAVYFGTRMLLFPLR